MSFGSFIADDGSSDRLSTLVSSIDGLDWSRGRRRALILARVVAAFLLIVLSSASGAQSNGAPTPSKASPPRKVTVIDSGISTLNTYNMFWVDNETVLFAGTNGETWERYDSVQVPVMLLTLWNIKTNDVRCLEETDGWLCYSDGYLLFSKYKTIDGTATAR